MLLAVVLLLFVRASGFSSWQQIARWRGLRCSRQSRLMASAYAAELEAAKAAYREARSEQVVVDSVPAEEIESFALTALESGATLEFEELAEAAAAAEGADDSDSSDSESPSSSHFKALLVKLEGGEPHASGTSGVRGQLGRQSELRLLEPALQVATGLLAIPGSEPKRMSNPDVSFGVALDERSRFIFDVDHQDSPTPRKQAERVAEFLKQETLRKCLALKVFDRSAPGAGFVAYAVLYAKDQDDVVHVERIFDVGTVTAEGNLNDEDTAAITQLWKDNGFVVDGQDDGGFKVETYAIPADLRLPPRPPSDDIAAHFTFQLPEAEMYYGNDKYQPGEVQKPFTLNLYEVMFVIDMTL